jgi:hypothetical protein
MSAGFLGISPQPTPFIAPWPPTPLKNLTVIRPNGTITAEQARSLLRSFRDLNLGPAGIEVSDRGRVVVSGCLSLDHPVESGVRYALHGEQGERVLNIQWKDERLRLQLSPPLHGMGPAASPGELDVPLSCDGLGRLSSPELGARLNLDNSDAMDIEHFLRRIVRAIYSKVG